MGFFRKIFTKYIVCPECREKTAKKYFGKISCVNQRCKYFDEQYWMEVKNNPQPVKETVYKPLEGDFNPGENSISIRYRNFRGDERVFTGDRITIKRKGNHINVVVAPKGKVISLSRDFIQNLSEIEQYLPAENKS